MALFERTFSRLGRDESKEKLLSLLRSFADAVSLMLENANKIFRNLI